MYIVEVSHIGKRNTNTIQHSNFDDLKVVEPKWNWIMNIEDIDVFMGKPDDVIKSEFSGVGLPESGLLELPF
jgi:hypothetical protein